MARWKDLAPRQESTSNQGGSMVEVRGVVLHIAQGSYEGTISWQKNATSDVSSHFIKGKNDGEDCQMVDTATTAWTQKAGNGHWLSIENAGFVPDKLTAHQVEFAAVVQARTEASGEELSSDAIFAAFAAEYLDPATHGLVNYRLPPRDAGGDWTIAATVRLDAVQCEIAGAGNGPIAAMARALAGALAADVVVVDYSEHALTAGADAMAIAYVEVAVDGAPGLGVGRHPDIVTASLHAVLGAVARARREGGLTEPSTAEYQSIRMDG